MTSEDIKHQLIIIILNNQSEHFFELTSSQLVSAKDPAVIIFLKQLSIRKKCKQLLFAWY